MGRDTILVLDLRSIAQQESQVNIGGRLSVGGWLML